MESGINTVYLVIYFSSLFSLCAPAAHLVCLTALVRSAKRDLAALYKAAWLTAGENVHGMSSQPIHPPVQIPVTVCYFPLNLANCCFSQFKEDTVSTQENTPIT